MQRDRAAAVERPEIAARYRAVRARTEALCRPLAADDYQVQSVLETSPPKWHIAHVTWFFETFVLRPYASAYRVFHPGYAHLFNSYYETVGSFHPRAARGVLSRPTVEEVYDYRAHVDAAVAALLQEAGDDIWGEVSGRVTLGLHHEQQHQELLLMDIKRNFFANPLRPAYAPALPAAARAAPLEWLAQDGATARIGHAGGGFGFDNESPRHPVLLHSHRIASRPVTNGEYLAFIEAGGYRDAALWLADGWAKAREAGWQAPLYWEKIDGRWWEMTLAGMQPLEEAAPVVHVSYYEADAYARWAGARLPLESELEAQLAARPVEGNFVESGRLHPAAGDGQWYGDVWEWTASAYLPYPGFRPAAGSLGEYNGKFMVNQMVLRGGCCATPRDHVRASYRNFFYPHDRWPFAGIRLARDA
jgi:ergothioneine biosynthesis protein EgtB